jgi:hypothetical protein
MPAEQEVTTGARQAAAVPNAMAPNRPRALRYVGLLALLLYGTAGGVASAQDAQYWTNQFGNRARLLGGAVIGSSTDLSAVYYCPGALALIENPELVLSANVFQYTRYAVQVADGDDVDLTDDHFTTAPALVAGEIRFGFLGDTRFGYSVLTRYKSEIRLAGARIVPDPPDSTGLSYFAGDTGNEQKLAETWVGFTLARALGGKWGIGVSPYLTVRSQRIATDLAIQTLDTLGTAAAFAETRRISYYNWRLLLKIGASANYGAWRFGATVTTPSLRLIGRGETYFNRSLVTSIQPGSLLADRQEDLVADYISPWAVGVGAGYQHGHSALNFAAEYFFGIDPREVLATEPFNDPDTGEQIDVNLGQEATAVLNFAVGWQQRFSEKLEAYAGFRTDFSGKPDDAENVFPLSQWNIYHLSGGAIFDLGRSHFTVGGVAAWGRSEQTRSLTASWDGYETAASFGTQLKYLRLTAILGFSIYFA